MPAKARRRDSILNPKQHKMHNYTKQLVHASIPKHVVRISDTNICGKKNSTQNEDESVGRGHPSSMTYLMSSIFVDLGLNWTNLWYI